MTRKTLHTTLTYCMAAVWVVNGLFCKVLNLAPRHEAIVARIAGIDDARLLTVLIGVAELVMAIWILSGWRSRLQTITQAIAVAVMNVIEFVWAPDLLLWGRLNIFFAFLFILVVLYNGLYLRRNSSQTSTACSPP